MSPLNNTRSKSAEREQRHRQRVLPTAPANTPQAPQTHQPPSRDAPNRPGAQAQPQSSPKPLLANIPNENDKAKAKDEIKAQDEPNNPNTRPSRLLTPLTTLAAYTLAAITTIPALLFLGLCAASVALAAVEGPFEGMAYVLEGLVVLCRRGGSVVGVLRGWVGGR
ncbi:hypothetical protein K402DRAFT_464921 [Aulographum hederae CBS 113979]|uniref:Uncharacterized protein n=1 Tax=Aulographum hederae CBS 113979 TaxID=1176131 RepID=A0A6G1GUN7_9PEZI|nr:hypothetical protein K402DRAFT_464921 [Aulographum hederae CBS 113979]